MFNNGGSFLGVLLFIQGVAGVFLTFFFSSSSFEVFGGVVYGAFSCYEGFLLRASHIFGGSLIFFVLYSHIIKGFLVGGFRFGVLWVSGGCLFLLTMLEAFLGYVLVWGQMSFWAAMVITSFLTSLPVWGVTLAFLVWGGFSVSGVTLFFFFSLHFLFFFVVFLAIFVHLFFLHSWGSLSLTFLDHSAKLFFHPCFVLSDGLSLGLLVFLVGFVLLDPQIFGESENFLPASLSVTPPHIIPEWYFLCFYGVLRSVPSKLGGVLLLLLSLLVLFVLVLKGGPLYRAGSVFLVLFFVSFVCLSWLGAKEAAGVFVFYSLVWVCGFFLLWGGVFLWGV